MDRDHQQLINEKGAAKTLSVALQTLRNWRFQHTGPAYCKLNGGRAVRYRLSDLNAFINRNIIKTEDSHHE